MNSKFLISLLLTSSLSLFSSSCSKFEDMSDNATKASENSGKAAKAASESRGEIAYSRLIGRAGGASSSRREAFESLLELTEYEAMRVEASKYLKGFEYQLWTAQKYDTEAYKEKMKVDALKEFFGSTTEIFNTNISKVTLNPYAFKAKVQQKNLRVYALATQLDSVNRVQEIVNNSNGSVENSMYEILKSALKSVSKVDKGIISRDELKNHEKVVQYYYEDAVALMQARHNMFLVTTLTKVSNIKKSKMTALKMLYLGGKFQSNYMNLNMGQQKTVNEKMLMKAVATRDFLESIGIEVKTHNKTAKILKNMQMQNNEDKRLSDAGTYEAQVKSDNLDTHIKLLSKLKL